MDYGKLNRYFIKAIWRGIAMIFCLLIATAMRAQSEIYLVRPEIRDKVVKQIRDHADLREEIEKTGVRFNPNVVIEVLRIGPYRVPKAYQATVHFVPIFRESRTMAFLVAFDLSSDKYVLFDAMALSASLLDLNLSTEPTHDLIIIAQYLSYLFISERSVPGVFLDDFNKKFGSDSSVPAPDHQVREGSMLVYPTFANRKRVWRHHRVQAKSSLSATYSIERIVNVRKILDGLPKPDLLVTWAGAAVNNHDTLVPLDQIKSFLVSWVKQQCSGSEDADILSQLDFAFEDAVLADLSLKRNDLFAEPNAFAHYRRLGDIVPSAVEGSILPSFLFKFESGLDPRRHQHLVHTIPTNGQINLSTLDYSLKRMIDYLRTSKEVSNPRQPPSLRLCTFIGSSIMRDLLAYAEEAGIVLINEQYQIYSSGRIQRVDGPPSAYRPFLFCTSILTNVSKRSRRFITK